MIRHHWWEPNTRNRYISAHRCVWECLYICVCVCPCVGAGLCVHVCECVCTTAHVSVCDCVRVCIRVCVFICVTRCVHVCCLSENRIYFTFSKPNILFICSMHTLVFSISHILIINYAQFLHRCQLELLYTQGMLLFLTIGLLSKYIKMLARRNLHSNLVNINTANAVMSYVAESKQLIHMLPLLVYRSGL